MLVEQAVHIEHLTQDMKARDFERWQLLQVLHQKDEQLSYEESAASRHRSVLAAARGMTCHYRVMCAFRAWRDDVQQEGMERVLMRARRRLATGRASHVCRMTRLVLKHAVSRQLKDGMHALWLHTKSSELVPDTGVCEIACKSSLPETPRGACESRDPACGSSAIPRSYSDGQTNHRAALQRVGHSFLMESMGEEHSALATPFLASPMCSNKMQVVLEPSPCVKGPRHCAPSPPSEASTCAPSSSWQSANSHTLPTGPCAAAQMIIALETSGLRCLFWALSRWQTFAQKGRMVQLEVAREHATRVEATASVQMELAESQRTVARLSRHLSRTEDRLEESHQDAHARVEVLQARWDTLEQETHELEKAEAILVAELQDARDNEDRAVLGNMLAEQQLEQNRASEGAALRREQQASDQLREHILALQDRLFRAEQDSECARTQCFASEQLLHDSQQSCARLEARLVRKAQWRGEAERQIREMVACGEGLQREQADLRRQLTESRRLYRDRGEHIETLRSALEQEEQLGEILKARLWVIEEDNSELTSRAERERGCHKEEAARLQSELAVAQREHVELTAELVTARRVSEAAETRAVDAARRDLLAVLSRERTHWAKAHGDLGRRLADAEDCLERARCQERAEATVSAEANAAMSAALRSEMLQEQSAMCEALRAEYAGENSICKEMAKELELRLAQATCLQEGLEERECCLGVHAKTLASCARQNAMSTSPGPKMVDPLSGFNHSVHCDFDHDSHQDFNQSFLQELDSYAELIEQLRSEATAEREEREASARDLATLRSSYRLLLQRVGGRVPGVKN